jgi:hypothetical protein
VSWIKFAEGKSGKREVAVSLILMWAFASAYLFYWLDADVIEKYEGIWETLTWAVLAWAAGAFGIDFLAKRGAIGSGSSTPPQTGKRVGEGQEGPL